MFENTAECFMLVQLRSGSPSTKRKTRSSSQRSNRSVHAHPAFLRNRRTPAVQYLFGQHLKSNTSELQCRKLIISIREGTRVGRRSPINHPVWMWPISELHYKNFTDLDTDLGASCLAIFVMQYGRGQFQPNLRKDLIC